MSRHIMLGKPTVIGRPHLAHITPPPTEQPKTFPIFGDRYRVLRKLHEGMSDVYEGYNTSSGNKVVIKVLPKFYETNGILAGFHRETWIMKEIRHNQGIVDILDEGINPEGLRFFVMPYLVGTDLGKEVQKGKLQLLRALNLMMQACNILDPVHSKGVVHEDIKLTNFFITPDDTLYLLDFGSARILDSPKSQIIEGELFMGTPHYTAPERFAGKAHDHRADIYSLGIVLYELLCGKVPFGAKIPDPEAKDIPALAAMHSNDPLSFPDSMDHEIPTYIRETISRALAKKPEDRFQSAAEMKADLELYLANPLVTHSVEAIPEQETNVLSRLWGFARAAISYIF